MREGMMGEGRRACLGEIKGIWEECGDEEGLCCCRTSHRFPCLDNCNQVESRATFFQRTVRGRVLRSQEDLAIFSSFWRSCKLLQDCYHLSFSSLLNIRVDLCLMREGVANCISGAGKSSAKTLRSRGLGNRNI